MSQRDFFQKRVRELEVKHGTAQTRLGEIREKLERADARRKADPTQRARWDAVLDNLEHDLAKTKAIIAHSEVELKEKRQRLDEAIAQEGAAPAEAAGEEVDAGVDSVVAAAAEDIEELLAPDEEVKRLLELPPEELVNLSDEEITLLQDHELRVARVRRRAGEDKSPKYLTPMQRRKQEKLRLALEKLRVDNFYGLTLDDMTVISEVYVTLNKIPKRTAQEEEMRFLIGGAIYSFEILYKYMQRWWHRAEGKNI